MTRIDAMGYTLIAVAFALVFAAIFFDIAAK